MENLLSICILMLINYDLQINNNTYPPCYININNINLQTKLEPFKFEYNSYSLNSTANMSYFCDYKYINITTKYILCDIVNITQNILNTTENSNNNHPNLTGFAMAFIIVIIITFICISIVFRKQILHLLCK